MTERVSLVRLVFLISPIKSIVIKPTIEVADLVKSFRRSRSRSTGALGAVKQFFYPAMEEATALKGISFSIERGERVAFLGPNGAGKSTTIKVLSGILRQTSGSVSVLGLRPIEDRRVLSYRVGSVFGNRSQLWYHLPPIDTFRLFARIYSIDKGTFERRLGELVSSFRIGSLIERPVRSLSLGERMRCELVASLLHGPEVLFLDEPTIGLDVTAKGIIRDILIERSEREGITLLFTSHDMGDIEKVCPRAIVINEGGLVFDGLVSSLKAQFGRERIVRVDTLSEGIEVNIPGVTIAEKVPYSMTLLVDGAITSVPRVLAELASQEDVVDISSSDIPLEEVIKELYHAGVNR